MKSSLILLGIVLLGSLFAAYFFLAPPSVEPPKMGTEESAEQSARLGMKLTSSEFAHNQPIPVAYTCDGQNIHPPLSISDVPENTKALALVVDDPDAPLGTWVHWLVWNISPDTSGIMAGSVPNGATEGTTSTGKPGYGGPCPPSGTHRYFFKLYALDSVIGLDGKAKMTDFEAAIKGHVLKEAQLVGTYERK